MHKIKKKKEKERKKKRKNPFTLKFFVAVATLQNILKN